MFLNEIFQTKKVSPFDQKAYETLNKAINNEGGYTITTNGGR
jgi:hypothetical protein